MLFTTMFINTMIQKEVARTHVAPAFRDAFVLFPSCSAGSTMAKRVDCRASCCVSLWFSKAP